MADEKTEKIVEMLRNIEKERLADIREAAKGTGGAFSKKKKELSAQAIDLLERITGEDFSEITQRAQFDKLCKKMYMKLHPDKGGETKAFEKFNTLANEIKRTSWYYYLRG